MSPKPACFESDAQWIAWLKQSAEAGTHDTHYCRDCLPEYQSAMIGCGRCHNPGVVFTKRDGEVFGVRPDQHAWFGLVTGRYQGTGKRSAKRLVGMGSLDAVLEVIGRRY